MIVKLYAKLTDKQLTEIIEKYDIIDQTEIPVNTNRKKVCENCQHCYTDWTNSYEGWCGRSEMIVSLESKPCEDYEGY